MRDLRIGLVGGGLMAKSHGMAFRNVEALYGDLPLRPRIVCVCDTSEELARSRASSLGAERWTTDWGDVVEDPRIDIVDIVTPNFLHKEIAVAACANGKHVYCEKPLAVDAADALAMANAAEKAGVRTLVGFSYLRNPAIELARELVSAGELGELRSFSATFAQDAVLDPSIPFTWRFDRDLAGAGALGDLGAHLVALARALVGDIVEVSALGKVFVSERPVAKPGLGYESAADTSLPPRAVENDDAMLVMCEFAQGAIGSLEASRTAAGRRFEVNIVVEGSEGAVQFNQQRAYELRLFRTSDAHGRQGFRSIEVGPGHGDYGKFWPIPGIPLGLHELKLIEVHALIDALASDRELTPNFREGWEVSRVLDAIVSSSEDRCWMAVD